MTKSFGESRRGNSACVLVFSPSTAVTELGSGVYETEFKTGNGNG
jgi:hypothetical protein